MGRAGGQVTEHRPESSDMIRIRCMAEDDSPFCMALKDAAGWNQTTADWRRFMALEPGGCFIGELDGRPVATAVTCVFGATGWMAMVLVDPMARGCGVGRAICSRALAYLDGAGVDGVCLDATAMGRPLYEKLGFEPMLELVGYAGVPRRATTIPPGECAGTATLDEIADIDRMVVGVDRRKLLAQLLAERPEHVQVVRQADSLAGFALSRPGTNRSQIGPVAACEPEVGFQLLTRALQADEGQPVGAIVPAANARAVGVAESWDLGLHRRMLRMCRGRRPRQHVGLLWATSGPEFG